MASGFRDLMKTWNDLEANGIPLETLENRIDFDTRKDFGAGLTVKQGTHAWGSVIHRAERPSFRICAPCSHPP